MKNEKNINYYRNLLHKDSVVLLVVASIVAILNLLFMEFSIFFKSALFIVFYIILLCNKKENVPFVGVLAIITGCLMIITSLFGVSIFDIIYILLGILYVVHSIIYLNKLKQETNVLEQTVQNKSNIPYINIGLIIFSIVVLFANRFTSGKFFEILSTILSGISMLFVFISSIVLMTKKYKSALLYITFVISIIFILFLSILLIMLAISLA